MLRLGIEGFSFADLQQPEGLSRLHVAFLTRLRRDDPALGAKFDAYRAEFEKSGTRGAMSAPAESEILIGVAQHVSRFVGALFGVEKELDDLQGRLSRELALYEFKREFVTRRVFKKGLTDRPTREELPSLDAKFSELLTKLGGEEGSPLTRGEGQGEGAHPDREALVARLTIALLRLEKTPDPEKWAAEFQSKLGPDATPSSVLQLIDRWIYARATFTHSLVGWHTVLQPRPLIPDKLVELHVPDKAHPEILEGPHHHLRRRDGFALTDQRGSDRLVMGETDYCVICHEREKDSCSKGFKEKGPEGPTYKSNALKIPLAGCPLEEHISEMHALKARGDSLGALSMVMLDNPMCPGTGHRICNDCMKACIFQKQEPVNIPQIETSVLTDVLALPWGFEIYGLLTRWNPLNVKRPYAARPNGKNVLVVGLGPAGYTLAHYLLNEGFTVAGIDGLKIERFADELVRNPQPIRDWNQIAAALDERILEGFGGVSEYGITVRWDKSFLTLIHLTLARRDAFRIYGGIRFGGTLTIDDAWKLGFDHIAIAAGAGKPTIVNMKNNLIRGVRAASDFLMALQLTGAFKKDSLANLQVRLPALVIGGGLTGIDTATELFAYYPVQVEKLLARHEVLAKHGKGGEQAVFARMNSEELGVYKEFLAHGRAIRAERERASKANELPNFIDLVRSWGGVSLCYRRSLIESPAYRLNHEEVAKALEEGIRFIEKVTPLAITPDEFGAVKALTFKRADGTELELPARTLCVAAGTAPNVTYEREHEGTFALDDDRTHFRNYDAVRGADGAFTLQETPPHDDIGKDTGFFTSYAKDGRFITFYGDNHPTYAGNVVKAMASAKDGFPHVAKLFAGITPPADAAQKRSELFARLDSAFLATVAAVNRLTPTIVEVVVHAPYAAQHFEPGQFYRLQNYERTAAVIDGTRLTMEGLALTGAWVDKEKGLLSTIVLEMGASSRLCAELKIGEPVVLMGPTGTPTHIQRGDTVLLAGGGLGNAVLFSIGQAFRALGSKVLYFAGYRKAEDAYKFDELERAADQVIWSVDSGTPLKPRRPQDKSFVGNIVQAMVAYAKGELGEQQLKLSDVDRLIAIGSDRMMNAVKNARHGVLQPHLKASHCAIGSINSPMQCMMKEICAQCLQRHVDPRTGKESFVFSCFNQDQDLDSVDFAHLDMRLRANSVVEKQSDQFLTHLLSR
ncbi:MAG: FAD-dependent oxidoreductase [Archangium sp.]|nr:FAD-dependent oxidoreductase [Archangium sp.]